jgi:hypothetical protein
MRLSLVASTANKIYLKYSIGSSEVFNILGVTPKLTYLHDLAKEFGITTEEGCQIALDRFNQMVAPYLNMAPVNLPIVGIALYLHDLIHEALKPGSVARFIEMNKQEQTPTQYSLQEYMDEEIAEYLSSSKGEAGLAKYVKNLIARVVRPILTIDDICHQIDLIMSQDLQEITSEKQKNFLSKFKRKLIFFILNSEDTKNIFSDTSTDHYKEISDQLFEFTKSYIKEKAPGLSLIDDELKASLIRRWLLKIEADFKAFALRVKHRKEEENLISSPQDIGFQSEIDQESLVKDLTKSFFKSDNTKDKIRLFNYYFSLSNGKTPLYKEDDYYFINQDIAKSLVYNILGSKKWAAISQDWRKFNSLSETDKINYLNSR